MNKFLKKTQTIKIEEEIENLNRPINSKEIGLVIKKSFYI